MITASEQRILDLSDSGVPVAEIAQRLGQPERRVASVVLRLSMHTNEEALLRTGMLLGSQQLLRAIMHARASQVLDATRPLQ